MMWIVLIYLFVYLDVLLRARSAYYEAEKYMDWYYNPEKKLNSLEKEAQIEKSKLDKLFAKNKISEEEYKIKLELIEFNKQRKLEESSLKYAYIWYKTVVDLFSPPESKWVKLARQKIPVVKQMWKEELIKKGFKIEDYMLE
ncbi:MAG: hypothetical protein NZ928_04770 [Endomicrobia bacterium]|nr:hypothetical protein [Endomicrobiia bacterium]MCX7940946.1 hypothetical protein [Endomicrobiia bacterium]MDW8055653.1 hypothetical protein [Elusimicrobiota bacterium]